MDSTKPVPQPIPYQGSKRAIAPKIMEFVPSDIETLFEPFAGSAAVTLAAAQRGNCKNFLISDVLKPLSDIWQLIVEDPKSIASDYEKIWKAQLGNERAYFDALRDQFNSDGDPAKLLYLIARCVKNAVRFNSQGQFNQSPDNRRKGMHPDKMHERIRYANLLLKGKTVVESDDFRNVLSEVTKHDLVYMDPPYQGTSQKKDTRYAQQLDVDDLSKELDRLNSKGIRYILSYDGTLGNKSYGRELSLELKLSKVLIHAGRSSQATLLGRTDETVESLYLSPALVKQIGNVPKKVSIKESANKSEFQDSSI